MGWSASIFTVIVFGSAGVAIGVSLASLRKRPDPMARPLAVLMLAAAAWAVPHAISLGFTDVEQIAFWHRMRYPGTVIAPVAYLVVTLKYAGHDRWLSRRVYTLLVVIPVITIIAVWTNPFHGLFWESLSIASVGGASVLVPEFGPWYWVNLGYLYLITIASLVVLGRVVVRSGPIYRKQAILMFVGGAVPLTVNAMLNFGIGPEPMVDFTTTALSVGGLTFALALFHFDLLDIRPVARDLLIEELDDGVVVVGPNERIRDFNPTAAQILEDVEVDRPADQVLPRETASDGGELVVEVDGDERYCHARSTTLPDERGGETGRLVYLNDVTDIVKREQRISVLNRVLRHNIRNELSVTAGYLELLQDTVCSTERAYVESARESTQRVIEFAEKARSIERALKANDTTTNISVQGVTERIVKDARETYPSADIAYEPLEDVDTKTHMRVADGELFEQALAELIENAVVHNDREPPQATVDIEVDDTRIRVSVADNGPYIPDEEREILNSRTETSLKHGSGLGLWLVKWTVSLSDGTLSFAKNEPRGTIVTLTFPSADR